jgi:hypothetical protein
LRLAEEGKEHFKKALDDFHGVKNDPENKGQKYEAFDNLAKVIMQITQIQEEKELDLAWCYTKEMWLRLQGNSLGEDNKNFFTDVFQALILVK